MSSSSFFSSVTMVSSFTTSQTIRRRISRQRTARGGFFVSNNNNYYFRWQKQQQQTTNNHHPRMRQQHRQHHNVNNNALSLLFASKCSSLRNNTSSSSSWKDAYTPEFLQRVKFSLGKNRELFDDTPPIPWKELIRIIQKEQNYAALYRSLEMQAKYVKHRDDILNEWETLMDYILYSKFHYEKRKRRRATTNDDDDDDEIIIDNDLYYAVRPTTTTKENNNRILIPNEFPYHVGETVEHWCLWKLHDAITEDDDIVWALQGLKKDNNNGDYVVIDTIHWTNPPHLQSIPEIDHAHIFCLRKKKAKK